MPLVKCCFVRGRICEAFSIYGSWLASPHSVDEVLVPYTRPLR